MSQTFSILVCLTLIVALSACNTTRGFGKDVESVGEGIQKSTN